MSRILVAGCCMYHKIAVIVEALGSNVELGASEDEYSLEAGRDC